MKTTAVLCVLSAALLLAACDHPVSHVEPEVPKRAEGEAAPSVSLPSPPPASAFQIPEKNEDGTLRVAGMIERKDDYLDKEVTVTGLVTRISRPCDPAKAERSGETCHEPHLVIRDEEEGALKQLLVVGFTDDFVKKAKLKEGEIYPMRGTYQMMGYGFTASEDGLIVLAAVDEREVNPSKK